MSHIEDDEYANFDDLEEDEVRGEGGLLDQENDDEGPEETIFGFDDSNDSPAPEECEVDPGGGVAVCPICQIELVGLSDVVRRSFGLDFLQVEAEDRHIGEGADARRTRFHCETTTK